MAFKRSAVRSRSPPPLGRWFQKPFAGIAQLVEHNLAKVGVASSSLVSRSKNNGWVAEWLCSGLQSRGRRFDSDPSLFTGIILPGWRNR